MYTYTGTVPNLLTRSEILLSKLKYTDNQKYKSIYPVFYELTLYVYNIMYRKL